jgi:glucose/arabinose dehydrogenase
MQIILKPLLVVYIIIFLLSACKQENKVSEDTPKDSTSAQMNFNLELVADKITAPLVMTHANDGSKRLFVVEQPGRIMLIKNNQLQQEPFLNIASRLAPIDEGYSEMGLLGLAFHPDYSSNGRFFVYYSGPAKKADVHHTSVVAEYKVSAGNPDKADMLEKVIMQIDQPESNHNGGKLAFGKDGFLYIATGDGGGAGDKHGEIGNGQNLNNLLGKILRIDVNESGPYTIPADNPFVNKEGADEIFAYGLRNPWRFSFDRQTGQLFCGDVGQNKYEEVNIIEKGKNYGWRAMEGEYEHSIGNSITGGYVYRGKQFPELDGKYFFADWSGKLFYLENQADGTWQRKEVSLAGKGNNLERNINSFGEDQEGEIYVITQQQTGPKSQTGSIHKLTLSPERSAMK